MGVDRMNGKVQTTSTSPSDVDKTTKGEKPAEEGMLAESREALIARLAYLKAKERGFVAGHAWDDWLAAEREIDAQKR